MSGATTPVSAGRTGVTTSCRSSTTRSRHGHPRRRGTSRDARCGGAGGDDEPARHDGALDRSRRDVAHAELVRVTREAYASWAPSLGSRRRAGRLKQASEAGGHRARGARSARRGRAHADRRRRIGRARRHLLRASACPRRCFAMTTRQLASPHAVRHAASTRRSPPSRSPADARAGKIAAALCAHVATGRVAAVRARARIPEPSRRSIADWSVRGAETGRLAEVLTRLSDYLEGARRCARR